MHDFVMQLIHPAGHAKEGGNDIRYQPIEGSILCHKHRTLLLATAESISVE